MPIPSLTLAAHMQRNLAEPRTQRVFERSKLPGETPLTPLPCTRG
jgi:hypothetical protein